MDELALLYQALSSDLGIVVESDNVALAKQRLYKARADAGDPTLACLQLRTSPVRPDAEIWIVKGPEANGKEK